MSKKAHGQDTGSSTWKGTAGPLENQHMGAAAFFVRNSSQYDSVGRFSVAELHQGHRHSYHGLFAESGNAGRQPLPCLSVFSSFFAGARACNSIFVKADHLNFTNKRSTVVVLIIDSSFLHIVLCCLLYPPLFMAKWQMHKSEIVLLNQNLQPSFPLL